MNKIRCSFLILTSIIALITVGCDKTEDIESPQIVVTRPSSGSIYENGDTISFHAIVSDNIQLTRIEIILVDKDNKPMLPNLSLTPGKNPCSIEGKYIISDPLLPGDVYHLRFRASDGVNVTNRFVEIQIHEMPQLLLYPVVVTHPEAGKWPVYKLTSANVWQEIYSQTGDYCGSAVNPAASQLYMCGVFQSGLSALELPEGDVIWTVKPGIHQSQHWFEGITYKSTNVYIACAEGNLRGYDKTGNEIYKSETFANAVPHQLAITNNFALGAFKDAFSNNRYLVIFHYPGGLMVYNKFMEADIACMVHTSGDKALILTNSNGQGNISFYNGADNSLVPMHSFQAGTFHEIKAIDSDNYLISSSNGIYWYRLSINSLTVFVPNTINSSIACDITTQEVFACSEKKLDVYTFPEATLLNSYPLPDTAVDLHLVYNK